MKQKTISTYLFAIATTLLIISCGQSEKEKQEAESKSRQIKKESIELEKKNFFDFISSTKQRFKSELKKTGDFFIDYSTGTIEVPNGYVWKLGKYNVVAKQWDTLKINNPKLSDPMNRKRLFGDGKILCSGQKCDFVVPVNKLMINGLNLEVASTPCSDYNEAGYNTATGENNDWNRLIIPSVFLPPGTKILVPYNRYEMAGGTRGILTIEQFELKDPAIITDFEKIVKKNRATYPSWNWDIDSTNLFKLRVIGEISSENKWYKP
jgi:hypothetical protein